MARLSIAVLLLAALAGGGCLSTVDEGAPQAATAPAPLEGARPLAAVSGADLVRRLEDRKARAAAFSELALRAGDEQGALGASLELVDVIICPQGEGKPPLHVVLTKLHARPTSKADLREYGYPVEDPEELFRPPSRCVLQKRNELVIFAFTQDGKAVMPFGGNNMLDDGIIADINGDGLIERADHCNYGISGIKYTQILEVCSIYEQPRPLLSVLYNWGETEDWGYQFVDRDGDGIAEIELGPVAGTGAVKPKAVFTWDKATKTYVGPEGKAGDHFRALRADDTYMGSFSRELDRIEKEVPVFAADPDAARADAARPPKKPRAAPPPARPYKYASLKGLTNPEIAAYMGRGKMARDFQPEEDGEEAAPLTPLPKDFWTIPPQQAALELVDASRAPWHRRVFLLAVDGRDGKTPPETCSIYFACHFAGDFAQEQYLKYFLRVDPKGCYLAYTCVSEKDREPDDLWARRSSYDLRRMEMKYEEARHFADVIWWLRRVRSWTDAEDSGWREGGAGEDAGALRMTWGQGGEFRELGTVWQGDVASRWSGPWGPDALVNVAAYLFQCALPERLGAQWAGQEPLPGPGEAAVNRWASPFEEDTPPQLKQWRREQARLHVARLIEFFSADESRLAHAVLRAAVRAAGDFALAEFAPHLRAIDRQLPPPARPLPTLEELQEQSSKAIETDGDKDWKAIGRLGEEINAMKTGTSPEAARERLRQTVALALRKIDAAGDPEKLLKWAQSGEKGWPWALLQLRELDTQGYVTALTRLLTNPGTDYEVVELLNAIARVAPARAAELAAGVPADKLGEPDVASRVVFLKADGIEDEARRVNALIKVMLSPDVAWKEKQAVVKRLVPRDAPLRHPDKKIDDALVALFAMAPPERNAHDDHGDTISDACASLALRGRVERFDDVARLLGDKRFTFWRERILSSLTRLVCSGGPDLRARMVQILRPNLKQTGFDIGAIIGCIYALDLRELGPDLEHIATAGPEDRGGAEYLGSTGKVAPITERYHLARKVIAAWNEEDPLARARLLIAFWWNEARFRNVARPAIQKQLQELAGRLSASDKRQVLDFLAWYETYALTLDRYQGRQQAFADMAELSAAVKRIFRTEKSGSP